MFLSRKKMVLVSVAILAATLLAGGFVMFRTVSQGKDLFRLNKALLEEGYYMADFEFKMMGIVYYLDKGHYLEALSTLSQLHSRLSNRAGLNKVPQFASTEEELEFYLGLQNPKTGAFMDESFPYCTFNEPTENVVAHIATLARETGSPVQLKYPLRYLDEVNTPEKLRAFLDDVSNIGWLGNRFPETTFVFARSLASSVNGEGVIRESGLYEFSEVYEATLLDWLYENQDPETGYWGPKLRGTGQLARLDLNNTASIIKVFVDRNGEHIRDAYPLRYRDRLFATTLGVIDRPLPPEDALDEWHDWNIATTKGIRMLLRYFWADASEAEKQRAMDLIADHVRIKFERFYVAEDGGFSLYPDSQHASLDGTATMVLGDIGAFSTERQARLWGDPEAIIEDLGRVETFAITPEDLAVISAKPQVNSLRFYLRGPDYGNLSANVSALMYPQQTVVLDATELVPNVLTWLEEQPVSMGNWTSKQSLESYYSSVKMSAPRVLGNGKELEGVSDLFAWSEKLTIVAFDQLQIPIYRMEFVRPADF
ncbi:hypothetical protein SAMN06265370_1408 [Puniceibacterium sediminis]|uniref:Uncharacterized protein n=2 Tax=Puniceibacterium sediminis TaxID=1608407 RepID=A0A238ZSM7_9RHOB|nr:hypothetical protein SAMN06265370_1408 [Puniceibacterium sediminis]